MRAMRKAGRVLGGLAAILVAGWSSAVVNLAVPTGGYTIYEDRAYGEGPRRKLDIYVPDDLETTVSTVLFFYGGNWQSGDKAYYKAVGQSLASKGMIAVIADYRLYPEILYPDFLYDAAAAFRFVHDHIADYGGDPSRLFVAGHSAGAYNAVMLASAPDYLRAEGLDLTVICGVLGIAGPYDFLSLEDPSLVAMFGGANRPETQPIHRVDGPRPPMLLVTGTEDRTVLPRNSDAMAARLEALGNKAETAHYEGTGHIGIILSMIWPFRGRNPLLEDVTAFVEKQGCAAGLEPAASIR